MEEHDIEPLLRENIKISRENNKLLKKLYGHMKWSRFFRFLYWALIIGSAFGLYWFLQPFIDNLGETYLEFGTFIENPREYVTNILPGGE